MHAQAVRATTCSPWERGLKKEVRKLSALEIYLQWNLSN